MDLVLKNTYISRAEELMAQPERFDCFSLAGLNKTKQNKTNKKAFPPRCSLHNYLQAGREAELKQKVNSRVLVIKSEVMSALTRRAHNHRH